MTHSLGRHFESPKCSRDKTRTNTIVNVPGWASKHHYALARLAQLQSATTTDPSEHESYSTDFQWESEAIDDLVMDDEYVLSDTDGEQIGETQLTTSTQCTIPDLPSEHLYNS